MTGNTGVTGDSGHGDGPGEPVGDATSVADTFAAAARRSGLGAVTPGEAPSGGALLAAMGGVRGLVESILPGLAFLVVYTITRDLLVSVLIPLAIAVLFVVVRIATKSPFTSAIAGVIGLALSAGFALITGRAEDNFLLGFFINGVSLAALIVSIAARRPLIGVIASLIIGEGAGWRADKSKFRVALVATFLWCGVFGLRLGIEVPLYFAGNVDALATLKLILGVPLYAVALWVTWLLMRTVYRRKSNEEAR